MVFASHVINRQTVSRLSFLHTEYRSPKEVEHISPKVPFYGVRGGYAVTVLLLLHYRAQIALDSTKEEVIDQSALEGDAKFLLVKRKTKKLESKNN